MVTLPVFTKMPTAQPPRLPVGIFVNTGRVTIQGGTYFPQVARLERYFGPIQISGGVFENPTGSGKRGALYDYNGGTLSDMLADGTAFAYDAKGSEILNAYGTDMSTAGKTVYVVPHDSHIFNE